MPPFSGTHGAKTAAPSPLGSNNRPMNEPERLMCIPARLEPITGRGKMSSPNIRAEHSTFTNKPRLRITDLPIRVILQAERDMETRRHADEMHNGGGGDGVKRKRKQLCWETGRTIPETTLTGTYSPHPDITNPTTNPLMQIGGAVAMKPALRKEPVSKTYRKPVLRVKPSSGKNTTVLQKTLSKTEPGLGKEPSRKTYVRKPVLRTHSPMKQIKPVLQKESAKTTTDPVFSKEKSKSIMKPTNKSGVIMEPVLRTKVSTPKPPPPTETTTSTTATETLVNLTCMSMPFETITSDKPTDSSQAKSIPNSHPNNNPIPNLNPDANPNANPNHNSIPEKQRQPLYRHIRVGESSYRLLIHSDTCNDNNSASNTNTNASQTPSDDDDTASSSSSEHMSVGSRKVIFGKKQSVSSSFTKVDNTAIFLKKASLRKANEEVEEEKQRPEFYKTTVLPMLGTAKAATKFKDEIDPTIVANGSLITPRRQKLGLNDLFQKMKENLKESLVRHVGEDDYIGVSVDGANEGTSRYASQLESRRQIVNVVKIALAEQRQEGKKMEEEEEDFLLPLESTSGNDKHMYEFVHAVTRGAFCEPCMVTRPMYFNDTMMHLDMIRTGGSIKWFAQDLQLEGEHNTGVKTICQIKNELICLPRKFPIDDVPITSLRIQWRMSHHGKSPSLQMAFILLNRYGSLLSLVRVSANSACAVFETIAAAERVMAYLTPSDMPRLLIGDWWYKKCISLPFRRTPTATPAQEWLYIRFYGRGRQERSRKSDFDHVHPHLGKRTEIKQIDVEDLKPRRNSMPANKKDIVLQGTTSYIRSIKERMNRKLSDLEAEGKNKDDPMVGAKDAARLLSLGADIRETVPTELRRRTVNELIGVHTQVID